MTTLNKLQLISLIAAHKRGSRKPIRVGSNNKIEDYA